MRMKTFSEKSHYIKNAKNRIPINKFKDRSSIEFNIGSFDNYRVTYVPNIDNMNYGYSPKDEDYFADLLELKNILGYEVVWNDYLFLSDIVKINGIYHKGSPIHTKAHINGVKFFIFDIVNKYPAYLQKDAFKLYMTLWAVMISEWYHTYNNRPSILKHTPKTIGVFQVLNEYYSPKEAAEFSKFDKTINKVLIEHAPDFDLSALKNIKLKKVMDIYGIDYEWINSKRLLSTTINIKN